MKKFLSIILALAMTIALIPAVSAETGDTYVFKMYGSNFEFTPSEAPAEDHAQLKDSVDGYGYIKFGNGAYISASESDFYNGTNLWKASISLPSDAEIAGETVAKGTYIPRLALIKSSTVNNTASKDAYFTFKFKVGTSGIAKNYTIKTETFKRQQCATFAVYANGAYLGVIED